MQILLYNVEILPKSTTLTLKEGTYHHAANIFLKRAKCTLQWCVCTYFVVVKTVRGRSRIFCTLVKNFVAEHRGGGGGGAPSELMCVQFYEKNVTWKMTVYVESFAIINLCGVSTNKKHSTSNSY